MSYTDNDFVKLDDAYKLAANCKSFVSSTRNLSGGWERIDSEQDSEYTLRGIARKAFVVRSFGDAIAAKVPNYVDGSMRWLIVTGIRRVTTAKHVLGIKEAVGAYSNVTAEHMKAVLE